MEVKDKILLESFRLFCRRGIKSVSMDDIALQLAVSKKTLYKWYENKDQIVFDAMQNHLSQIECDCEHHTLDAKNAIDEMFMTMDMMKRIFSDLHPSVFYDLQKFHPAAWNLFNEHKSKFILHKIVDNIRKGMEQGLYRADLEVDVMARLRLAQIEMAFNPDFFPPDQFAATKVQLVLLEHFMLGIATLKGHRLINKYKEVTEEE